MSVLRLTKPINAKYGTALDEEANFAISWIDEVVVPRFATDRCLMQRHYVGANWLDAVPHYIHIRVIELSRMHYVGNWRNP